MNLYTLHEEEAAHDRYVEQRAKDRKVILGEEETKAQGEELYAKVVTSINKQLAEGKNKISVSCKLRPNCVFTYVVEKLKNKGWGAWHICNDGMPSFDHIIATPPPLN